MKRLLIIIDGMDDEKIPELGNLTPSRFARMPALDYMREHGVTTLEVTVPEANTPATDVALLKILGYDVNPNFEGRSWFEALGQGVEVGDNDLCLRCNLISIKDGIIISHSGNDLSASESDYITELLKSKFESDKIKIYGTGTFRQIVVIKDCSSNIECNPPHELIGQDVGSLRIKADDEETQKELNRIIEESRNLLQQCKANGIALWAPGRRKEFSPKIDGTIVAGVSLVKGIGKALGMQVADVAGATGDDHTDYHAKLKTAINALNEKDFLILHIEAADEASHERDYRKKVKILEEIDEKILQPLLNLDEDVEITVQADHATSSMTGKHLNVSVEVVKFKTSKR